MANKRTFLVYYSFWKEQQKKQSFMRLVLEPESTPNLKEIFYDSCPEETPNIMEIKEILPDKLIN